TGYFSVRFARALTDGTVYLRPAPDKPRFVEDGGAVGPQDVVALIEVMKTFTNVRAGVGGRLLRYEVADGASVHEGAVIAWLVP
ncbi:MAG TPA: hypothetical protein PKA48_14180, partial [Candidatus Obscuribacter sp.]|nr:hypothetical protein [Candidatus Obscuribacter sp.]